MASLTPQKPNILFILTDDQGPWALAPAGNNEVITPNLTYLAQRSLLFENFFCTSPVCSPARASLLTGRIPSQHGVHDWIRQGNIIEDEEELDEETKCFRDGKCIEYLAGMPGYTDFLAANGYCCGLSGKWHLGDSRQPQKGFTYWQTVPYGGSSYFNAPVIRGGKVVHDPRYLTDVITENALQFLAEETPNGAPFYLGVHYTAPHSPWDWRQHPAELADLYRDCPFQTCPQEPIHPWQINSAPRGEGERRRELLTGYYAAITGVDFSLGRLLQRLEEMGVRQNTLVIFTSDNGMNMGHHGIWGKGNGTFPFNMYDTSVKVPFLVSPPGWDHPTRCGELVSQYDFLPTLLDYLGIPNPLAESLPGRSFAPLLRGEPLPEGSESVVVFDEYGPVRMIRTRHWKYVHRYPYGPNELYDLVNDPEEQVNRIAEPALQKTREDLKAELDDWFLRYADPAVDGTREAVTGKGQLELAGVWGRGQTAYADDWEYIDPQGNQLGKRRITAGVGKAGDP